MNVQTTVVGMVVLVSCASGVAPVEPVHRAPVTDPVSATETTVLAGEPRLVERDAHGVLHVFSSDGDALGYARCASDCEAPSSWRRGTLAGLGSAAVAVGPEGALVLALARNDSVFWSRCEGECDQAARWSPLRELAHGSPSRSLSLPHGRPVLVDAEGLHVVVQSADGLRLVEETSGLHSSVLGASAAVHGVDLRHTSHGIIMLESVGFIEGDTRLLEPGDGGWTESVGPAITPGAGISLGYVGAQPVMAARTPSGAPMFAWRDAQGWHAHVWRDEWLTLEWNSVSLGVSGSTVTVLWEGSTDVIAARCEHDCLTSDAGWSRTTVDDATLATHEGTVRPPQSCPAPYMPSGASFVGGHVQLSRDGTEALTFAYDLEGCDAPLESDARTHFVPLP